jgi:aryl-alcohol dehydrogenase-like predicted oxidoreductase
VFVIDKIDHLDRPVAAQADESIARLGFQPDVFVFHGVSRVEEYSRLDFGGLAGKSRFRGVSTHHPDVLALAIESCDLVMFAIGPHVDGRYLELLQRAKERGVATVCFKTFGAGKLLGDTEGYGRPIESSGLPRLSVEECLHYTLTLDPDVALLGLSTAEEQDVAFAAADSFGSLPPATMQSIRA